MSLNSFRASMEAGLGGCARCMTLTAVFLLLSWAGVAALGRMEANTGLLVAATLIAVMVSTLGMAHAAAYIARRMPAPPGPGGAETAASVASAPRDCGCRRGAVRLH